MQVIKSSNRSLPMLILIKDFSAKLCSNTFNYTRLSWTYDPLPLRRDPYSVYLERSVLDRRLRVDSWNDLGQATSPTV